MGKLIKYKTDNKSHSNIIPAPANITPAQPTVKTTVRTSDTCTMQNDCLILLLELKKLLIVILLINLIILLRR